MKNRKQLPEFGYLSNIKVDIPRLVTHCEKEGLLDPNRYVDIQVSANSATRDLTVANHVHKNTFFLEDGAESLEGEKYRQLYLTEIDPSKRVGEVGVVPTTMLGRLKRLDSTRAEYLPEADERNYGVRNELVSGYLAEVLDMFESKLARVRFAYLAPHFKVKPHVDYDPSYVTRYHIPLITNTACIVGVERKSRQVITTFPANGRVYFLNTGLKHWVENCSDEPRIHLIIDVHEQTELEHLVAL
jgi:hypothetical protein